MPEDARCRWGNNDVPMLFKQAEPLCFFRFVFLCVGIEPRLHNIECLIKGCPDDNCRGWIAVGWRRLGPEVFGFDVSSRIGRCSYRGMNLFLRKQRSNAREIVCIGSIPVSPIVRRTCDLRYRKTDLL